MRLGCITYNVDVHTGSYCWGLRTKTPITHIFPLYLRSRGFRCSPSRAVPSGYQKETRTKTRQQKGRLCFGGPRARGVRGLVEGCWEKWYPYCTYVPLKSNGLEHHFASKTAILGMICPYFWRPCLGQQSMRHESFVVQTRRWQTGPCPWRTARELWPFQVRDGGKAQGNSSSSAGNKEGWICHCYYMLLYVIIIMIIIAYYYHDYHILSWSIIYLFNYVLTCFILFPCLFVRSFRVFQFWGIPQCMTSFVVVGSQWVFHLDSHRHETKTDIAKSVLEMDIFSWGDLEPKFLAEIFTMTRFVESSTFFNHTCHILSHAEESSKCFIIHARQSRPLLETPVAPCFSGAMACHPFVSFDSAEVDSVDPEIHSSSYPLVMLNVAIENDH